MLEKGKKYKFQKEVWECTSVNTSRATLLPVEKKVVDYATTSGKKVKFKTNKKSITVSPASELEEVK